MSRWFRFYDTALDDPKVQKLSPALFKTWVNVLCIASKHDGCLPPIHDLAFMLRMEEKAAAAVIAKLQAAGLIDETPEGNGPHNWDIRQHRSDDSAPRVREHRKRQRDGNGQCNALPTVTVTPPDTEADTDPEAEGSEANASGGKPPEPIVPETLPETPRPPETPRERLWREGKPAMLALGVPFKQVGAMMGRWLKDVGDDHLRVLAAILRARDMPPADAISWITAHLSPERSDAGKAQSVQDAAINLQRWVRERTAEAAVIVQSAGGGGPDETASRQLSAGSG